MRYEIEDREGNALKGHNVNSHGPDNYRDNPWSGAPQFTGLWFENPAPENAD